MIWVDWCLLAALAVSILIGLFRGFTREVLGLATWIVAIIGAILFGPAAAVYLEPHISVPSIRLASAYGLVFFGGLLIGAIATGIVSSLVRRSRLSGVDRTVGGGFGLVRGVLAAVLFVWLVGMTPARQDPWWNQSFLIGKLDRLAQGFNALLPSDWQQQLESVARSADPAEA